jgi:hypothetical protein
LYEAALLWQDDCFYGDWYLACVQALGHVVALIEPWHHATMLLPSQLLCNRPDKGKSVRLTLLPRSGFVQVGFTSFGCVTPRGYAFRGGPYSVGQ